MTANPRKAKRRWLRFGLRSFLTLITAACVWLGIHSHGARQQQAAVRAIQEAGGSVEYDFEYTPSYGQSIVSGEPWEPLWLRELVGIDFFHRVYGANLAYRFDDAGDLIANGNVTNEVAKRLRDFPRLRRVVLLRAQATDEAVAQIAALDDLEEILIYATFRITSASELRALRPLITDNGVADLVRLPNLRSLHIENATLTDRSLASIGKMTKLQVLELQGESLAFTDSGLKQLCGLTSLRSLEFDLGMGSIEFSDQGIAYLQRLRSLESIQLRGRGISDNGLKQLVGLPKLQSVSICTNAVTPEGLKGFEQRRPDVLCTILEHRSFAQEVRELVADEVKVPKESIDVESSLDPPDFTPNERSRILKRLTEHYFEWDERNREVFLGRVKAEPNLTVHRLGALVQQTVGRSH